MKPAEGQPTVESADFAVGAGTRDAGPQGDSGWMQALRRGAGLSRGIGARLLLLILVFSTVVTLLLTALQLFIEYRRDVAMIEDRLGEIGRSSLETITASLWNVDGDQLRLHLEGLLRLPDMRAMEVRETMDAVRNPLVVAVGERSDRAVIERTFPLVYVDRGVPRTVGVLYAQATLDKVYRRLLEQALVIMLTQGVKTFLVSLFILYIVQRLVTRHLIAIARFLTGYHPERPSTPLALERTAPRWPDELDRMVEAFNDMGRSLQRAFDDLRAVQAELEKDIAARIRAEAEVIRLNAGLEQRVRQRTAELEAANRELGAFSYSVSHDLRAPLRRIDGFVRILEEEHGRNLDERGRHFLNRISGGARDLSAMIDSFLKLSRSTRGELALELVDLSRLAAEIVAELAEKEPERSVAVEIAPDLHVQGDRRLLRAALENLLENAWKYTRRTEAPSVAVGREAVEGGVAFVVRDNGAGFDMAHVGRLFTPFNRLHRPEEFEGTGIGLATVQRIVARHGGRVWAEGKPGQGAAIFFTCWDAEASA